MNNCFKGQLRIVLLAIALVAIVFPANANGQVKKPNVVYFLVDNLGMGAN